MEALPDSVMTLYQMKTLKISNNNLGDINPRLSLLDNLVRLSIEGNPLKRLKPAMRTAGAKALKEFLKLQLGD
jgi:Leucine-rich repeat (LRR) protein